MPLSKKDYDLSMRISRRSKVDEQKGMRSLLVHRLRLGAKALVRMPMAKSLTSPVYNIFCEPCDGWMNLDQMGIHFVCPGCEREYMLEFASFAQLEPIDDPE